MTKYTADAHALPYPEGVDKVAVHSDIQALAVKTGIAISVATLPAAAEDPADPKYVFPDPLEARLDQKFKGYADTKIGKDRTRLVELEEPTRDIRVSRAVDATDARLA